MARARELIAEERFSTGSDVPGVWSWQDTQLNGGFRPCHTKPALGPMKMQEVDWFGRAASRFSVVYARILIERKIEELEEKGDPLAEDFAKAAARAEAGVRMARSGGDYPLLSGGDINLYSLFVERAMSLVKPSGMVGLLTPSGIASDKTAAPFFKRIATTGRLKRCMTLKIAERGSMATVFSVVDKSCQN